MEDHFVNNEFIAVTLYSSGSYSCPEGVARCNYYPTFSGTPDAYFDGIVNSGGGMPSGSMYNNYLPLVNNRVNNDSPLLVEAYYYIAGDVMTVQTYITVDQPVTTTNNKVRFFLCEDDMHGQSNMVVDIAEEALMNLTTVGSTMMVERSFDINGFTAGNPWIIENLNAIVFVQSDGNREVLQADIAEEHFAATLEITCNPPTFPGPWELVGPDGLEAAGEGSTVLRVPVFGEFTLTWIDVPTYTGPETPVQVQAVPEDGTGYFEGTYVGGPFENMATGPLAGIDDTRDIGLIDFDNDGDLDIHVVNYNVADQLLRNDGNDVFTDIAAGDIANTGTGDAASWADLNKDGILDMALVSSSATIVLQGDGLGGFTPANISGIDGIAPSRDVSWVDYNLDGNLDLHVTNYYVADNIFQNVGEFGGLHAFLNTAGETGKSSASAWGDFNNDGRIDYYNVKYDQENKLFENMSAGFNPVNLSGTGDTERGNCAAWGDFDNDGDFDLVLVNDTAGGKLFQNNGSGSFSIVYLDIMGETKDGREVVWGDFDNDTNLDLYVARAGQPDLFLVSDGNGDFVKVPVGLAEITGDSETVACGDIDNNGRLDIVLGRKNQSNVVFKSLMGSENHWTQIRLTGVDCHPDAIGARVVVTVGDVTMSRLITSRSGGLALGADFGLGSATNIDQIDVYWPGYPVQTFTNIGVDSVLEITQYEGLGSTPVTENNLPRTPMLGKAHPNPFNPSTTISFSVPSDTQARLDIYSIDGKLVRTLVNRTYSAGSHDVMWNGVDNQGRGVASGTYFYRLTTGSGFDQTGRMALVK